MSSLAKSTDKNGKKNLTVSCKKFAQNYSTCSASFFKHSDDDKEWILDYLCSDMGVIPCEKIKSYKDLDSVPEGEFYRMTEFYNSLKNEVMKPDEYEHVKILAENENEKAVGSQRHLQFSGHNNFV